MYGIVFMFSVMFLVGMINCGGGGGSSDLGADDANNDNTNGSVTADKFGGHGTSDGKFSDPMGIAIDEDGYVYVSDTGNARIQKLTANGVFVTPMAPVFKLLSDGAGGL